MPRRRNDRVVDDVELIDLEEEPYGQSNGALSIAGGGAGGVRMQGLVQSNANRRGIGSREDRVTVLSDHNDVRPGVSNPSQHPYREDAGRDDSLERASGRNSHAPRIPTGDYGLQAPV